MSIDNHNSAAIKCHPSDYTLNLPDECLSSILQSINNYDDRSNSSLVCHRWLRLEAQSRRRLKLHAQFDVVPSIFARFDSITDLALICSQGTPAILGRTALHAMSSLACKNLTRLTLSNCKVATCGVDSLVKICARLEELHLEKVEVGKVVGSGADPSSLKVICLDEIDKFSACYLAPLIKASKSLTNFKLSSCGFNQLGTLLGSLSDTVTQIHVEQVTVNDIEMGLISTCCPKIEVLCLVKFLGNCSDAGIAMVANKCRFLRKLHIEDCWKRGAHSDPIGDEGLIAVANNCPNIEELVLEGVGVTQFCLGMLFSKCVKLEALTLCNIKLVKDAELMYIASKCNALKRLWIEYCAVSDNGIQGLANGCPNLVEVMFRECLQVTLKGILLLKASRASLVVDFDEVGRSRRKAPYKLPDFSRWAGIAGMPALPGL